TYGCQRQYEKRNENGLENVVVPERPDLEVGQKRNDNERKREQYRQPNPILADRKNRHIPSVRSLELPGLAIEHRSWPSLDPLDNAFAKQPLRPHEEHGQCQDIREPVLNAAADIRPQINLCQLFTGTDDKPANDSAWN